MVAAAPPPTATAVPAQAPNTSSTAAPQVTSALTNAMLSPPPIANQSQLKETGAVVNGSEAPRKRVPKPSMRNAEMDKIGSTTTPAPKPVKLDLTSAAEQAAQVKQHLLSHKLGDDWVRCVEGWFGLEAELGYGSIPGTKSGLPAAFRPSEYSKWSSKAKNGLRPYTEVPFIADPMEFGLSVVKWYNNLMPTFRRSVDGMPSSIIAAPAEIKDPWGSLRRAGPNGVQTLLILLMWWGASIPSTTRFQEDSTLLWKSVLSDAVNVFEAVKASVSMMGNVGNMGKRKRSCNDENVPDKR
ncbi:hypothetical protein CVT24_011200 [Panaeolus cyanescens]|uniref:Uncharacterized protein n=1 Tax=Panaeolus cyanescens TaxID=181874 RepID=A0A409X9Q6_9AGAR|nr:hypothetical protein CVT24_011200 [Panaeolus cyanescens]